MFRQTIPIRMEEETAKLLHGIVDIKENVDKVSNISWNIDDKKAVTDQITEFLEVANEYKEQVRNRSSATSANRILALECVAGCWLEEIEMWVNIEKKEYDEAWDHLISSQDWAESVAVADQFIGEKFSIDRRINRLSAIETVVFPEQVFVSPGMVLTTGDCSICDEPYEECNHFKGLAYNGEFCKAKIEQIQSADHLAIVDEPEDKRARVTAPSMMTGLPEEEIDVLDE